MKKNQKSRTAATGHLIRVLFYMLLSVFFCSALLAEPNTISKTAANASAARRPGRLPRNHWDDYSKRPGAWYRSQEGIRIADNILSWQSPQGSWPKNVNTTLQPFTSDRNTIQGTFDNGATTEEIRFLARAFRATKTPRYRQSLLKGIDHIFKAQYPTGGWPQYYPPGKEYPRHITFNDNSMVRLMKLLRDVASSPDFAFVDTHRRKEAQKSFDRGVQCILKCQVIVNGKPTVWCAQHDELDCSPRPARTYELISLSGSESAGILQLLMSLDNPNPEVAGAVSAGAEWFASSKITGIRIIRTRENSVVKQDPNAPPIWARFYEIETNRPIFSGRDGVKKYNLAEIELERRRGYGWYGYWGARVAEDYAAWKEKRPGSTTKN
ncbi:MAG: pectate lyase [Phycisphaerae bacterium]|jgi:pectate lyase